MTTLAPSEPYPDTTLALNNDKDTLTTTTPSLFEQLFGIQGSPRRHASFFSLAFLTATLVRIACFSSFIFGRQLVRDLGPVERDGVRWGWILATRFYDLALATWVWKRIDGAARKDAALYGALFAAVSRVLLYAFEHSYFLLSAQTTSILFLTDLVSLASGLSLLTTFLPHSPSARPVPSTFNRLLRQPELFVNLAMAVGLATTLGALIGFAGERKGGMEFVKENVFERVVPYTRKLKDLEGEQVIESGSFHIPALRTTLEPLSMSTHLFHSLLSSLVLVPFVSLLPSLSPSRLSLITFLSIITPTTLLFWDVLPVTLTGAAGVATALATKAAVQSGVIGWVLEELRRRKEKVLLVVQEVTEDGEVVEQFAIEEEVLLVEEEEPVKATPSKRSKRGKTD